MWRSTSGAILRSAGPVHRAQRPDGKPALSDAAIVSMYKDISDGLFTLEAEIREADDSRRPLLERLYQNMQDREQHLYQLWRNQQLMQLPPPQSGQAAGEKQTLFKNITVFKPSYSRNNYIPYHYPQVTAKDLEAVLSPTHELGLVVPVESQPEQLLWSDECDAVTLEDVDLDDDLGLAVVVDPAMRRSSRAWSSSSYGDSMVQEKYSQDMYRPDYRRMPNDVELALCRDEALKHLQSDPGCSLYPSREIAGMLVAPVMVSFDALAYSEKRIAVVQVEQVISRPRMLAMVCKKAIIRNLIQARAPGTEALRDPSTDRAKKIEGIILAEAWESDPEAAAACYKEMSIYDITPMILHNGQYRPAPAP